jgi:hypothetical protein
MARKLAIKSVVIVPVKFSMADGDKTKSFAYTLECERIEGADWDAAIKNDDGIVTNELIREKLIAITTGWRGQTFVLEEDGTPAEFCREAFEDMLGVPGVLNVVVNSFLKESAARAKN